MTREQGETQRLKGLALPALTALVVGSMIGGGIFGLPSQMARAAAPGPLLIGWAITGFGMLMLALSFQSLAMRLPRLDGGVYGYARAGFGNYVGFCAAMGYWIGVWIGNVGFLVLLMSSIGTFVPAFEGGNTPIAIACASALLWVVHYLVLRGVETAAIVNVIVTIAKVVPLIVFIVVSFFSFKIGFLTRDFWGEGTVVSTDDFASTTQLGSPMAQIVGMMLITVWVFSGVEGASIFSRRARQRRDVGRATVLGFLFVLALLIAVNLLSYGVMSQTELSAVRDPSLAGVFAHVVGPWGAKFIAAGLTISLLGVLLSWILLATEILRIPAADNVIPTRIGALNSHGTPRIALWLSDICVQIVLLWTAFSEKTYEFLILLASGVFLIPYTLVALFQLTSSLKESEADAQQVRKRDVVIGVLATIYGLWLIYAGGLAYFLGSITAYLVLTPLYVLARREAQHRKVFKPFEWAVLAVLIVGTALFVWMLAMGRASF
ncbi:arginine-ornithine antiporter [Bowdeniella nasicola]|uniref:Arginine-ornithine antiporter n=1 Tax=Bowdeniella nasicola TaxID=208480 RepID=A0A1Q5Q5Q0_9ACTO|nr:basic amino acid/polyamine antiporter [Bowdeniella nasicola]OKL55158.1 arginine-ornithine antiporter [Bowdeniella nasicola]